MNPDNPAAVPQLPKAELIWENSMSEQSSEALAIGTLDFTLKTEPEAFINEASEDCKMFHMCEEPGCSFITKWDFALNHHAKTHHQKKSSSSRGSAGFNCRMKLENLLCHSWDYESCFKVNFDIHLRNHYDWTSQKILRAPKDEELMENGGRCKKCGFESVSNFLVQVHNFRYSPHPSILLPNYNVPDPRYCKTEQGLYQCNFCDFTTKCRSSFVLHRKNVALHQKKVKWIICPFCDFKHKKRYKMSSHVHTLHKSGIIRRPVKLPLKFGCTDCNFRATRRSYLAKHILTCQIPKVVIKKYHNCSECTYKTKNVQHLRRHVLVKHTPEEALQMVACDRCSYKAKCFDNLRKHLVSIHGSEEDIKWFHCDHCQFKTKSKSYLNKHITRKHFDPKCLKCDLCEYSTKNKRKFKKHLGEEHGSVVVKNEVHEDNVC